MKLPTTGAYTVDVVGEAHHQEELRRLAGKPSQSGHYKQVTATLRLEPSNPADPHAVRVEIGGRHVGYLDRASAKTYKSWLAKHGNADGVAKCPAVITGGFRRAREQGFYGVVLDLGVHGVKRRDMPPADPSKARRKRPWWQFW